MKIATVIGVRPQFVKAAAVSPRLREVGIREVLIHTGQHSDRLMSAAFFEDFGLPEPDYRLRVDGRSGRWARIAEAVREVAGILRLERPNLVLVYGDADPALIGALAAARTGVSLAHVEAGLRAGDLRMAEEANRRMIGWMAALLFAPTETAAENLRRERVPGEIHLVGDVMLDTLRETLPRAAESGVLRRLGLEPKGYAVATVHRAEAADDPAVLRGVLEGLDRVAEWLLPVILPAYPRLARRTREFGLAPRRVRLAEPLSYPDMIWLLKNATLALTDSGGLQKEACWLGVPCVVLRDATEWAEAVASGWSALAGTDPERIFQAARRQLFGGPRPSAPWRPPGGAAARIVGILARRRAEKGGRGRC